MGTMTRLQVRDFVRVLLSEPTADRWADSELNSLIDYGQEDFASRTEMLRDIDTQSVVSSQEKYDLPSDYVAVKKVEIRRGDTVYLLWPDDIKEFFDGTLTQNGTPCRYNIFMEDLFLKPSTSYSDQTTALNGSLTATATTVTVDSTASFSQRGRITVESEVIDYTGTTSTTFTGCTRGVEGSTAAAHADDITVTQRGLWIWFAKKPAVLSSDASTLALPSQFDRSPAYWAAAKARQKTRDYDLAKELMSEYEAEVRRGLSWISQFWKDKVHYVK